MRQRKQKRLLSCSGRRYLLAKVVTVLMVPFVMGGVVMLVPETHATDNWNVEGANGVLHVRGALSESACRLDMTSAYQDVWLGDIGTARLAQAGARGTPVKVQLRLQDCLRSPANNRDQRSGNLLWNPYQPAASVSFAAPADSENPQLIGVRGASGIGLRMLDEQGRDIRLGSRGAPLMLAVGQDSLTYTLMPERTRAPLQAGAYTAHLDFRLNYD